MFAYLSHFTRMAAKALIRFRMHTLISLLSLTFGFLCYVSAVLIANYSDSFDQHFPNADRIFNIIIRSDGQAGPDKFPIVNNPAARYLRAAFPEVPNIVRSTPCFPQDVFLQGRTVDIETRYIEPRFFDIFPLEMIAGIDTGEALPPNSVAISEEAALRNFGRTDVVGERLLINNRHDVAIAGVFADARFPTHLQSSVAMFNTELIVPIELQDAVVEEQIAAMGGDPSADRWGNQSDNVYVEIPEDLPFNVADFNERLHEFVATTVPTENSEHMTYELSPINKIITTQFALVTGGFDITDILIVAGALVLMIGCLNYSNLVIAQLSLRGQEIGVQKILGAKRSLLLMQYCFESLLFVLLSLSVALVVLFFVLSNLQSAGLVGVSPAMLINPGPWLAIFGVIAVIVAIAGGYPALRTATVPLVSMLRPKGSSGYS